MNKITTSDNFQVYSIEKDNVNYYLADKEKYKENIDDLLLTLDDLLFDSLIFIFGFDTGEYMPYLKELLSPQNKVIIIEPNAEIYNIHHSLVNNETAKMVYYSEKDIKHLLSLIISVKNFTNLYVHAFGNYKEVYKDEYENFTKNIDNYYFNAYSAISCASRFKDVFLENILANLSQIKNSSPLNSYINSNVNIPAIIVSAGPSLDKNLADMIKNKDKLKKSIVIAGNRTLKVLLENNIKPDLLVSIDPINANYDMLKDYLDSDVYLAFYEYSNKYLVRNYKGEKIYISGLLSKVIDDLKNLKGTYAGGSVAHTCIDIARIMGCNPIILVGQDLAHTYDKIHSDSTVFDIDKLTDDKRNYMITKDVYGNDIKTTATLERFKIRLEEYINDYEDSKGYRFINSSYGAYIKGSEHIELKDVFNMDIFNNNKNPISPDKSINFNFEEYKDKIKNFVMEFIDRSDLCIKLCNELIDIKENKDLVDIDDDDLDLQKFLYILNVVDEFESSPISSLLGGYFSLFIFQIKNESFKMLAKDYDKYTSNLNYQSSVFLNYFEKLNKMLNQSLVVIDNTINEFY